MYLVCPSVRLTRKKKQFKLLKTKAKSYVEKSTDQEVL